MLQGKEICGDFKYGIEQQDPNTNLRKYALQIWSPESSSYHWTAPTKSFGVLMFVELARYVNVAHG